MSTMRGDCASAFFASAAAAGTIASRNGRPMSTPVARRKVRRSIREEIMEMRGRWSAAEWRLFVKEYPALRDFVDETSETVILRPNFRDDLLHDFTVGKLNVRAG